MAIAFIDAAAHRHAVAWYRLTPFETMGSYRAPVTRAVPIARISLEAVLEAILATPPDAGKRDVIIVGHARDIGLAMPLSSHGRAQSRVDMIRMLAADRGSADGLAPPVSAREISQVSGLPERAVDTLRDKMNRVRALRINSVSFRACNIGRWIDTLRDYRRFFGCARVTAPDVRDSYGRIDPGRPAPQLDHWLRQHGSNGGRNAWTVGQAPGRIAFSASRAASEAHSYSIAMACERADALRDWQMQALGRASNGPFIYHGMYMTYAAPGQPQVVFVGEREFGNHIVSV